jgi:hypothetical protein
MPSITPTFTNPISLRLFRQGQADTIIRFDITSNSQLFTLSNFGTLTGTIGIDPSNWIINGNGGVSADPTLGLNDPTLASLPLLEVYPNPSAEVLNVKGPNEKLTYIIFNALGKTVKSGAFTAQTQIDIQDLPSGTYILKCSSVSGQNFIKLVTIK